MKKMPTIQATQDAPWKQLGVIMLIALLLTGSYLGSLDDPTVHTSVPVSRVPIYAADIAAAGELVSAGAEAASQSPQETAAPAAIITIGQAETAFEVYRKDLMEARETAGSLLDDVIYNSSASAETVQAALRQKAELARSIEVEIAVETLLRARGFSDALCTVRPGAVNVVVKGGQLTQQQASQILDIAMSESGEPASNVRIIPAE